MQKMLPYPNTLPSARVKAKGMLTRVGMDYNIIHVGLLTAFFFNVSTKIGIRVHSAGL